MEKLYNVLYVINNNDSVNQRFLSKILGLSIGNINSIIKILEEKGYISIEKISGKNMYIITNDGLNFLSEKLHKEQSKKIKLHSEKSKKVKQAVILAAGEKDIFEKPVGFLPIGEKSIIERQIDLLEQHEIEKIVIVVGYKSEYYEEYAKDKGNIVLVKNDRYKWTGTMESLSLVKDIIDDDFILLENDMVFEERAIKEILNSKDRDCMVITSESGSGDEALVEIRDGYVYRMSKDVHQFNKIDGEMIGISKISYKVFNKMLDQFKYNKNPYLNYEYAVMDIGRECNIGYIKIDDLVWGEIDSIKHYDYFKKSVYNRLLRKEEEIKINNIKDKLVEILFINPEDIIDISSAGGMTNKNYKVNIKGNYYILRMPGTGTEDLINRVNENNNVHLVDYLGIDSKITYFNEESGIKLSEFIENAETLNSQTSKREDNMELTTSILRKLHTSNIEFKNEFNVFDEINRYERLLEDVECDIYEDYAKVRETVISLKNDLDSIGVELKPCHNDTVPENFIKDDKGRIYLIDWEYSGSNDPMWDLAAHILECNFSSDEEELFLQKYFEKKDIEEKYKTKILIYKILQDFLWSIWTIVKESKGDNFGSYGLDRYNRAKQNILKMNNAIGDKIYAK